MPAKKKTSRSRFIDEIQHRNQLIEFHCTVHGADETECTSGSVSKVEMIPFILPVQRHIG